MSGHVAKSALMRPLMPVTVHPSLCLAPPVLDHCYHHPQLMDTLGLKLRSISERETHQTSQNTQ